MSLAFRFTLLTAIFALAVFSAPAQAQSGGALSADYRALLEAAAARQDDAGLRETAELVASVSPAGEAGVRAALAEIAPERMALFADWTGAAGATAAQVVAEAEVPPGAAVADAEVEAEVEEEAGRAWFAAPLAVARLDGWDGRLRIGVNLARGNTEKTDYAFALDLDRDFSRGWSLDSHFEYLYTETDNGVEQDRWSAEGRLERQVVDGFGYYGALRYVSDQLGSYETTAAVTGGVVWTPVDRDAVNWSLRAGAGVQERTPRGGAAENSVAAELGSDLSWTIAEGVDFTSETAVYLGGGDHLDQRFALTTNMFGAWALEAGLDITHEFEPTPGSEATDTRLNLSLVREF